MYYSGIEPCDILNGEGFRTTIWVSGCSVGCKGCFNPKTHNRYYGKPFTDDTIDYLIECLSKPQIQGLTITGGNPTEEYNINDVEKLVDSIKNNCPGKDIWIYSPYTWKEIKKNKRLKKLIKKCDVLIDGKYDEELRDVTLKFRGSSNQNIIKIK